MAKKSGSFQFSSVLVVGLLVAGLFGALKWSGSLQSVENLLMDLRFRYRGPIEAPVKVVYINRGNESTEAYGHYLFPRENYGKMIEGALDVGKGKAIFFDFILSEYSYKSEVVDADKLAQANEYVAEWVKKFPEKVVLACNYNQLNLTARPGSNPPDKILDRLDTDLYPPELNPYPETPQYPIWNPGVEEPGEFAYGKVGLINVSVQKSAGAVIRYVPSFVEVRNELHTRQQAFSQNNYFAQIYGEAEPGEVMELMDTTSGELGGYRISALDGFVQRDFYVDQGFTFYTPAIQLLVSGNPGSTIARTERDIKIVGKEGKILYQIPLINGRAIELNWFSQWISRPENVPVELYNPQYDPYNPMVEIVRVNQQLEQLELAEERGNLILAKEIRTWFTDLFQDAYVLVGPTDPILQDVGPTPFEANNIPRVSVHGNLLKTITANRFINRLDFPIQLLLVFGLTLSVSSLVVMGGTQARIGKLVGGLVLVTYVFLSLHAFRVGDLVVPLAAPVGSAFSAGFLITVRQLLAEERQKSRIKNMFGTYVSPDLVHTMVESGEEPRLGGHTAEVTAFFSDIQSFSTFSEILSPGDLVEIMNEYLDGMTTILEVQGGTLDKYIGDAIVGIFGAPVQFPNHALKACIATQLMHRKQRELAMHWKKQGERWPALLFAMQTRIGLNTGEATVGNMGSQKRFNYTMMGDMVNLAARNESGAKAFGVYTMVSEFTKEQAMESGDDCVFRYLDRIVVKGRSQPVAVHEVVCLRDELTQKTEDCIDLFQQGIDAYLGRNWMQAHALFSKAEPFELNQVNRKLGVSTNPSLLMASRCLAMKENPPEEDWDGRYVMTSK